MYIFLFIYFQVTVNVKLVGFINEETVKQTKYGLKRIRTVIIADKTKTMKLPLWESNITKVERDHFFYQITNLISATFNNMIQLNTTSNTVYTPTKEFNDVHDDFQILLTEKTVHRNCQIL